MRLDKLAVTAQEASRLRWALPAMRNPAPSSPSLAQGHAGRIGEQSVRHHQAHRRRSGAAVAKRRRRHRRYAEGSGSTMPMAMPSNNLMKVIDNAVKAAERMGDSYATTEHLPHRLGSGQGRRRPCAQRPRHHGENR